MVFISTGGFKMDSVVTVVERLLQHGITNIELSGGLPSNDLLKNLKAIKNYCVFRVHNYFPPPNIPFVFNLGSLDDTVAELSIEHVRTAMRWSIELGQAVYSFHAGFLMDPRVDELGQRIKARSLYAREECLGRFVYRTCMLAKEAAGFGVSLLIENNVLSLGNFAEFGSDPLLMTGPEEAVYVMRNTPDNVGMLVDVAHLKVSAQTLGYDAVTMFGDCREWIRAYHLSDNDGTRDSNHAVTADSWFWPYLLRGLDYYSLEVYDVAHETLVAQRNLVERILNGNDV